MGGGEGVSSPPGRGRIDPQMMKIIKHGLLAVGGLILFLLMYKFIASFFVSSTDVVHKNAPVVAMSSKPESTSKAPTASPVQVSNTALDQTDKKVNVLEQERGRLNADLLTMHGQVRDVTQTVSNLVSTMDDLKQSIDQMHEKMEQQSQELTRLQSMQRTKRTASASVSASKKAKTPRTRYFIQAIIPGRAWLTSSAGATLTVSRGSAVPGYGDVRLINPKLGRVFTSSGRVIQFSQTDT